MVANCSLLALALVAFGPDDDAPAVRIVAHRPSDQLAAVLALFDGTPARNPAAWLAAWRRATGDPDLLPKAPQALIAALNPGMTTELAALDGASFRVDLDHAGAAAWSLRVLHDDGTFAALSDAMALTDGGADEPFDDGIPVDRLDRGGTLLFARAGAVLAFGSGRDALRRALREAIPPEQGVGPGLALRLDPHRLASARSDPLARLGRSLQAAGLASIDARLALEADTLALEVRGPRPARAIISTLDRSWLTWLPDDAPLAFSVALDSDAIDLLAGLAAGILPDAEAEPRARLSALALAAGVLPEIELWPRLRGLSGFVLLDDHGRPESGALTLHARDEEAAERLARRTLPRLLRQISVSPTITTHRSDVLLAWGRSALDAAARARSDPARSLDRALAHADHANADHLVLLRPGPLLTAILPADSPASVALRDASPILLHGRREPDALVTRARWSGLRETVRRLVAATPQAPPAEPTP
jgi:hypothetical protein